MTDAKGKKRICYPLQLKPKSRVTRWGGGRETLQDQLQSSFEKGAKNDGEDEPHEYASEFFMSCGGLVPLAHAITHTVKTT